NGSPAAKKVEQYAVDRVTGDGRCLFRALVKGMAFNKGLTINPRRERDDAVFYKYVGLRVFLETRNQKVDVELSLLSLSGFFKYVALVALLEHC
ncbi:hypothetical protein F2Q70_00008532, partial [Brassica cretica]